MLLCIPRRKSECPTWSWARTVRPTLLAYTVQKLHTVPFVLKVLNIFGTFPKIFVSGEVEKSCEQATSNASQCFLCTFGRGARGFVWRFWCMLSIWWRCNFCVELNLKTSAGRITKGPVWWFAGNVGKIRLGRRQHYVPASETEKLFRVELAC